MGKSGKSSGNGLLRWIIGIIFILIVIAGINAGLKDDQVAEGSQQIVQQTGETGLVEAQAQAEGVESGQGSGPEESSPADNLSDSSVDYPADDSPAAGKNVEDENLTVHFIDVGQGDSILLEYDGKTMLVDAGERDKGTEVSEYLREQSISSIDYVVATHPHSDHIGGMDEVLNSFQVGHFIDSGFPHTSKTYENMLTTINEKNIPFEVAKKGEKIELDPAVDIEVLNPESEYSDELNENSVVLKVNYGEVSFLLMGDAGLKTEEKLMSTGYDLDSDILKVGHHASRSGSGEAFISAVSPEISVIEVGAGNDYGHPHAEILDRLQITSKVFRTDLDGSITVTTDGSAYTITTQKSGLEGENPENVGLGKTGSEENGMEKTETAVNGISTSAESTVSVSDLSLQDEWVEITNRGSSPVSLTGWKIEDDGSKHTYTFPSCTLDSQATVTLYTGEGTNTATELYWGSGSPIWNNDGDTAYLYDNSGNMVASLER